MAQAGGTSLDAQRDALWKKRLDVEDWERNCTSYLLRGYWGWRRILGRRPFLRTLLRLAGLYDRGADNARRPVLTEQVFSFPDLPPALDGWTILHLSDPHFSDDTVHIDAVCRLVDGIEADLCVITGDFAFDKYDQPEWAIEGTRRLMNTLAVPRPVYAVLGNNDFASFVPPLETLGIEFLHNRHVVIERDGACIALAGVDDPRWYRADSVDVAMAGVPPGAFPLLLAHSPESVADAQRCGVRLYLCGHTHGGQIRLPGLGPIVRNVRCSMRYFEGPWQAGAMHGYTSRGLGTVAIPVRFNCPPEATRIVLRRDVG